MLSIGMIGSIGHNRYVFDGVRDRDDVTIVGVAPGPDEDSAESLARSAQRLGHSPTVYTDFRTMLDAEKPDVVTIACQFNHHALVALEALQRECHLFVEKPLATTLEDLYVLEKTFRDTSVELSCMLGLRYAPPFRTAWQAVRDGAVGEVRLMNAQKSYKLGNRAEHYCKRETFGGTIPWVGSHAIDWVHWFSGETFERVYATHSTKANDDHGDLEATALCHFTMTNEVFASVTIDYLRPAAASSHGDDRLRVVGREDVIEVQDGTVKLIDGDGSRTLDLVPDASIFGDFLDQIQGRGKCLVTADDAFRTTRACLLARQSADEGRVIAF